MESRRGKKTVPGPFQAGLFGELYKQKVGQMMKKEILLFWFVFTASITAYAAGNLSFTQTYESTDNLYGDYSALDCSYMVSSLGGRFYAGDFSLEGGLTLFNVLEHEEDSYAELEMYPEMVLGGSPEMLFVLKGKLDAVSYGSLNGGNYTEFEVKAGLNADDLKSRNAELYIGFGRYDNDEDAFDRMYVSIESEGTLYTGLVSNISASLKYRRINWPESSAVYSVGMGMPIAERTSISTAELTGSLRGEFYLTDFLMVKPAAEFALSRGDGDILPYLSTDTTEPTGEDSLTYSGGGSVYLFKGDWSLYGAAEYLNCEFDSRVAFSDEITAGDETVSLERVWLGAELSYFMTDSISLSAGWSSFDTESNDYFVDGTSETMTFSATVTF